MDTQFVKVNPVVCLRVKKAVQVSRNIEKSKQSSEISNQQKTNLRLKKRHIELFQSRRRDTSLENWVNFGIEDENQWKRVPIINFGCFDLKKMFAGKDFCCERSIEDLVERRLPPEVVQRIKHEHNEQFKRTIDRILNNKSK